MLNNPRIIVYSTYGPSEHNQHPQCSTRRRTTTAHAGAAPLVPNEPLEALLRDPVWRLSCSLLHVLSATHLQSENEI